MSDDIAIQVHNVSKSFKLPHEKHGSIKSLFVNGFRSKRTYEKQEVLKNISFDIKKGEFFGIVGRNGSGKSTLLKLMAGIYAPNKGNIQVNGKLTPFIELGVGFNPNLTGRENVFLNGALLGFSRPEMAAMYDEIVEFAELERFMDQRLKNYSSGMQVRLAFSIATRARGDILLLDEVLAVGDANFQQKCYNYFEKLKNENKTIILVSHDMAVVRRFCTKAIYIKEGEIINGGSPMDISDLYISENIQENPDAIKAGSGLSDSYRIVAKIKEQTEGELFLNINFKSQNKDKMYIGISVYKDGVSVAEITTDPKKPLIGSGVVTYSLDTDVLNGGTYAIGVALFKVENRELLSLHKKEIKFMIKNTDIKKGGALKLKDTWRYGK